MPRKTALAPVQITPEKILPAVPAPAADNLRWWAEQYLALPCHIDSVTNEHFLRFDLCQPIVHLRARGKVRGD